MGFLAYVPIILMAWLVFITIEAYVSFRHQYTARVHGSRAPPSFMTWFAHQFVHTKRFHKQTGAVNIGGTLMLGIAMVFLAIGFIFLPITTDAAEDLLDWTATCNTSITDATYTGYTSMVGITPLLILVGFVAASVVSGMMGVKIMKGATTASANPGSLILVGLSIVFIGIGLIIEPVMLEGVATVVSNNSGAANTGQGISTSFTGYSTFMLLVPMLVHIGFLAAAVLSGFFGLKKLGGGGG